MRFQVPFLGPESQVKSGFARAGPPLFQLYMLVAKINAVVIFWFELRVLKSGYDRNGPRLPPLASDLRGSHVDQKGKSLLEDMAYRSFRSEKYSARGVRKVTTGITGLWQPSVHSDGNWTLTNVRYEDV